DGRPRRGGGRGRPAPLPAGRAAGVPVVARCARSAAVGRLAAGGGGRLVGGRLPDAEPPAGGARPAGKPIGGRQAQTISGAFKCAMARSNSPISSTSEPVSLT